MLIQYDKIPFLWLLVLFHDDVLRIFCVCYCRHIIQVHGSASVWMLDCRWKETTVIFSRYHVLFKSEDQLQQMCLWFSDCIRVETHPQSYCLHWNHIQSKACIWSKNSVIFWVLCLVNIDVVCVSVTFPVLDFFFAFFISVILCKWKTHSTFYFQFV